MKADYVGQPQERPQVFNRSYSVSLSARRRPAVREYKRPWIVSIEGALVKKFRTHAEAIRWADKRARKSQK